MNFYKTEYRSDYIYRELNRTKLVNETNIELDFIITEQILYF